MATAATRPTTARPDRIDPRVSNPLDQLRGTIRRYVLIEGLLSAAIFVAAWFAVGLLLDFGLFKVATWDWVLEAPRWLRGAALAVAVLLLAVIVTLRIVRRLTRELSYPALALVLERRFPDVLGDRLITAVELADVEDQARYGYSADMIRQTIAEAKERVAGVPVNDVFNWRRLRVMAGIAIGLTLGVVLVGFASYAAATKSASPYRYGWRFAHVVGTFLERDVLLMQTPWPRRAHLELAGFPDEGLRIGKDAAAPTVRVRAYEWVVADRSEPFGWRPMRWSDVTPELVGGPVPELPAEAIRSAPEGASLPEDTAAWKVDQVESLVVGNRAVRDRVSGAMPHESFLDLDGVFEKLRARADEPSMGRTLRRLAVPEKVTLIYYGKNKTGDVTLSPQQGNEFAGVLSDLKESVEFVVRAEDFRTPRRSVTLIPPPMLARLVRTEFQPAYLHHPTPAVQPGEPAGEGPFLKGRHQRMPDKDLSLTGDRSVFAVPTGTEVVLTAVSADPLRAAYLQPKVGILPWAVPGSAELVPLAIGEDGKTFSVELRGEYRLTTIQRTVAEHYYFDPKDGEGKIATVQTSGNLEFDVILEDRDGIRSKRQVLIQVAEDQPPSVEVAIDVVRKVGNFYYVTPKAKVPFNPESIVRDDFGLAKVEYVFDYWPEESEVARGMRAQLIARSLLYPPGPGGLTLPGTVAPAHHARMFEKLDRGDTRRSGSAEVGRFFDLRNALRAETRPRLSKLLEEPLGDDRQELVKTVPLKSQDADFFDLGILKLGVGPGEVQPRYRIDMTVVATDTNLDTGPRTGQNPDAIKFLVVSEGDLLAEINKEEENFAARLDEALAKLGGARKKWEFVHARNNPADAAKEQLDVVRVRANDAAQDVAKARDAAASVLREYRRIARECQVNGVNEAATHNYGRFANRLDRLGGESPPPVNEEERLQLGSGILTPRITFPKAEGALNAVLNRLFANDWADPAAVSDAAMALTTLEQELLKIRKLLGEKLELGQLTKLLERIIESRERMAKELRDWQRRVEETLTGKEPILGPAGPVLVGKGEAKKIKHAINWAQFDKDDLAVKVTVNDPAGLTVPATLKLTFDNNPTDFEYEVRGGQKDGEFTITLTPDVGKPVQVRVTVK